MDYLVIEKTQQAISILNEFGIDLWITFVRETSTCGDPVLPLIYGHDLTWPSAILISKLGRRSAVVGYYEAETARQIGAFDQVIAYDESLKPQLLELIEEMNPRSIAVNYSENDVNADGLSLGMYRILTEYLTETRWKNSLISAEQIIGALKGRKTLEEITRIQQSIKTTEKIFLSTFDHVKAGMSEVEIASFMRDEIRMHGLYPAWESNHCPTVNAGPESPVGHVSASDIILEKGHILHIDFGVNENNYCSDIQRVAYVLNTGESIPPEPVLKGFKTIVQAIENCVKAIKPGIPGYMVDKVAREYVQTAGYPEYKYATGHQLGRLAHDGAGIIGPRWERYRNTPEYLLEEGQVYTIEPGLEVPGFGYIGIEEDVLVTANGCQYLSDRQEEMVLI